ncbi:hypothetical protein [Actinomadura macra]|uniref:hypothetical protein n=1 Tax=Actinomadura macra TaxID=46164 RepID=UPI00082FF1F2|nr:hypothetical protein [Actinomadura macra]
MIEIDRTPVLARIFERWTPHHIIRRIRIGTAIAGLIILILGVSLITIGAGEGHHGVRILGVGLACVVIAAGAGGTCMILYAVDLGIRQLQHTVNPVREDIAYQREDVRHLREVCVNFRTEIGGALAAIEAGERALAGAVRTISVPDDLAKRRNGDC